MDISLDPTAAGALLWLTGGAEKSDHGSVVLLDFIPGKVIIRTNTVVNRSITLARDPGDDGEGRVAVRAKALAGVAGKVEEGASMGIRVDDSTGRVHASCGATSVSLSDLSDHVMTVDTMSDATLAGTVDAGLLGMLYRAYQVSGKDLVTISGRDDDGESVLTVGSGTDTVYTQEVLPYSQDPFRVLVRASELSHLRGLTKLGVFTDAGVNLGTGMISLSLSVDSEEGSALHSVSFVLPTVVTTVPAAPSPCDGDIHTVFTMPIKTLRAALKPLSGVVPLDADLTLAAEGSHVTARVSDPDGNAKVVIMQAVVAREEKLSVTFAHLLSAMKSLSTPELTLGRVTFDDRNWVSVSGLFDEASEDSEEAEADIIVALLDTEGQED